MVTAKNRARYRELVSRALWDAYGVHWAGFHRWHWRAIDAMFAANRPINHAVARMLKVV